MVCNQNNYLNLKLGVAIFWDVTLKKKLKFWLSMVSKYPCLKRLICVLNLSQCKELECSGLIKALYCMQKYRLCKIVGAQCRNRVLPPGAWASTLGKPAHGRRLHGKAELGLPCLRAGDDACQRGAARGLSAPERQQEWAQSRTAPAGPGAVPPLSTAPCLRVYLRASAPTAVFLLLGELRRRVFGFVFFFLC